MIHRVALVRTDVSEEPGAPIIRVTKIGEPGTMANVLNSPILAFLMMQALSFSETWGLQEPHSITCQKTAFFRNRSSFRNTHITFSSYLEL
jgi:hypothetical protein